MSFFILEQGADPSVEALTAKGRTLEEVTRIAGERALKQGKTFDVYEKVGEIKPVNHYEFVPYTPPVETPAPVQPAEVKDEARPAEAVPEKQVAEEAPLES